MDIQRISNTSLQANERPNDGVVPQDDARQVNRAQSNRSNASVQGADYDLSEWTLVNSEPLSVADKAELQRARLARSNVDSAIADTAKSLGRLRTFLTVITFGLYKAFATGRDAEAATELKDSFAADEGTGLVKLALDNHEDDFSELSKGRERALIDINSLCKQTLDDFHSGVYGDNFDRPLNEREQAARDLMEGVRQSVLGSADFWITEERFDTLVTTHRATLLGFAQLHLLQRAESIDGRDEAGKRNLLKESLTEAMKDLLRLGVGKPEPIAPLAMLVPAEDKHILNDKSAQRLLLRVYGELKKIEGTCPGCNLSDAQRPAGIRLVVKILKKATEGITAPQERAAVLAQVVGLVTESNQTFVDFMARVVKDLGAENEKMWILSACVENLRERLRISHDIAKIKGDLAALKVQHAQNRRLGMSPVAEMIASIEEIKPPVPEFVNKTPDAKGLQFAKFQFAQVKSLLTAADGSSVEAIRTEAYFSYLGLTDKAGLGEARMNLLTKMVKASLLDVFSRVNLQTLDQFKANVGQIDSATDRVTGRMRLLMRLSPEQAKRFADMPNLNFEKAVESLSKNGKPLSASQAVAFLGSLVDNAACREKIQNEGLAYVKEQGKALAALTLDNLKGVAQGRGPVFDPPNEALASRFETLKRSKAFASLMEKDWTSSVSQDLFDKMRDAGAATLLYGDEGDLEKFLSDWKALREAVDEVAELDYVKNQAQEDVRAQVVNSFNARELADWLANGGDVQTFKNNCETVFKTKKPEFDGTLNAFKDLARGMGLDEGLIGIVDKEVCRSDVFGLGGAKGARLLTPTCVGDAENAIKKLADRHVLLQGVKFKYESFTTDEDLKPFLMVVAEILLQGCGKMFTSVDDAISFAETLRTAAVNNDMEKIGEEVDDLRREQGARNAEGVKRGVVRTLIRVAETGVRVMHDPAVRAAIESLQAKRGMSEWGLDEEEVISKSLNKAILSNWRDAVVASQNVVARNDLYEVSATEDRCANYGRVRRSLMDLQFGVQGPRLNVYVQNSANSLFQVLFGPEQEPQAQ